MQDFPLLQLMEASSHPIPEVLHHSSGDKAEEGVAMVAVLGLVAEAGVAAALLHLSMALM